VPGEINAAKRLIGMAAFAGQLAWRLGLQQRLAAAVQLPGAELTRKNPAELGAAGAFAGVGLGGLFGMPVLLIVSVLLDAPLAAPAAIALGFLATAHALAFGRQRRAAAWSFAVLAGLIVWTLLFLVRDAGGSSWAAFAAALAAPIFAGAPVLARHLAAGRENPRDDASRRDVASLDELAPSEAVLFVDRDGRLLAGTRAGRAALALPADAGAEDIGHAFLLEDRPALIDAIARCRDGAAAIELILRRAGENEGDRSIAVTVAARGPRRLMLRLRPSAEPAPLGPPTVPESPTQPAATAPPHLTEAPLASDIAEAAAFAWRRIKPNSAARAVAVAFEIDPDLSAACDRRDLRRVLCLLLDCVLRSAAPRTRIVVSARRSRGAVLLRARSAGGDPQAAAPPDENVCRASLEEAVDQAGGTIVVEECETGAIVSVRLAIAPSNMAEHP
jgi:hypothetical protein